MPLKRWIDSLNNAIEGIIHVAKNERHLRYHFYSAFLVIVLSYILGVTDMEFILISICAMLVIVAEMFNTVVEMITDKLSPERTEFARIIKDTSAGAVLITAVGSIIVGFIILFPYLRRFFAAGLDIHRRMPEEVSFISIIIVLITVLLMKAHYKKGKPLRGGMPSGHSAVAFSMWLSVTLITRDLYVMILTLVMAVLIAHSRVNVDIHTPFEVITGAIIGILITGIMFIIFT